MTALTTKRVFSAVFACAVFAALPLGADDADIEMLEEQAFRAAVARVAPSVVRIETVGGLQRVGRVLFAAGPTTGLVVDKQGYIISSAFGFLHRPTSILVRLPDDTLKPAELVATDHSRMLVLLKIDVDEPLPLPEIAPLGEIRVGQWAIAVGRTFDVKRPNMAVGIVSALGRVWGKAIQTDAAVSPSNYGGPLIDLRGRVLGVLAPLSPHSAKEVAGYEWYDSGIAFAVPAEHVLGFLPRLRKGDLHAGVIGITLKGANPSIGEPVIDACRPNSPADEAGLKPGDRIVEIEGRKIIRAAGVKEQLGRRYAGDKVRIVVLRNDKRIERQVELVAKLEPYRHPMLGILPMRTAGDEQPETDQPAGVVVRYVCANSPAAAAGIKPGDMLISLDAKPVTAADQLREMLGRDYQVGEEVELGVRRDGKVLKLYLKLAPLPEDLPPKELPPAHVSRKPHHGERPEVGTIELKVPEMANDAWAYVPEAYDPRLPHGVAVWLHPPGGFDHKELLRRWKPLCDSGDLILLAPKSADPNRWAPGEAVLVRKLLDDIVSTYTIDPARVVVLGAEGGGTLGYLVALGNRDLVRAVALVDAPIVGRPPENEPLRRLAVYSAVAKDSPRAAAVKRSIGLLRERKIPVTEKDLGKVPRPLSDDELSELARWIDMLDRI